MKTIEFFFNALPEPYKTLALENCRAQGRKLEQIVYGPYEALDIGMYWKGTPQGHKFWFDFSNDVRHDKVTLIFPKCKTVGFGTYCRRFVEWNKK